MKFASQLVTKVSGSVGGLTGSHNAGGMYFRGRATPTNPNSPQQQAVRSAVSNLSVLWIDTLTTLQRDFWTYYASLVQITNPLGEPINVGGKNMYVRSNTARLQAGLDRVDDAPLVYNVGDFTTPSGALDEANDELDLSFTNTDAWANEDDSAMLVWASRPQNPTINYFKGPYRFAGLIAGDSVTPPTSPAAITLPFAVGTGQRIFYRVAVTRADGRYSYSFRGFADA